MIAFEVLFSGGEPGIEEALLEEGMRHQRCIFNGERDFSYILCLDGLKKAEELPLREKLVSIPAFQVNRKRLKKLSSEDLLRIKTLAENTQKGFQEMIELLNSKRYPWPRAYIENLSQNIATFFSWWLKEKRWIPLSTNQVENVFSRIRNRIWSIGKRWSKKGLLNHLHVTVNKILLLEMWKELWEQYMSLTLKFQLTNIHLSWRCC